MVITFPNMGTVALAARALFQALKIPYVMPERNNKKTLEIGTYYAPEEICLPFKLVLGNFIQSIENGADTFLITGSCGPCRFGEYCELLMKILKKMGYKKLDFIVADLSSEIGIREFMRRMGKITGASPLGAAEKFRAFQKAFKVLDLCDKIEAAAHYLAGFEANRGECKKILYEFREKVYSCQSVDETLELLSYYKKKIEGVRVDREKDPIKISIIGEIFTIIDPFSNLFIEDKLMECGVSSKRTLSPSWWVRDLLLKPVKLNSYSINKAAGEYLPYSVGGHGRECIGEAVLAKSEGMDGAIQIFPLGCMPEVIAKSVLPTIRWDKGLPIMSLIVDVVSGEAGYITRIEAFVDMLENGRRRKLNSAGRAAV